MKIIIFLTFLFLNAPSINFSHSHSALDPDSRKTENFDAISKINIVKKNNGLDMINVFNLIIGFVGVLGTIYTIISWRSNQKDRRIYKYLFETAEKNIENNITEEQLKSKKQEVHEKIKQIKLLEREINENIPKEARKAVLKDKLNTQTYYLMQTLNDIKKIQKELTKLGEIKELPKEILKSIEKEISPSYIIKEKISKLKTYLTIITATAAIISSILFSPYDRLSNIVFFVIALPFIVLLFKYSFPTPSIDKRNAMKKIFFIFLFVIAAIFLLITIGILVLIFDNFEINKDIFPLALLSGFICFGLFWYSLKGLKRLNNLFNKEKIAV